MTMRFGARYLYTVALAVTLIGCGRPTTTTNAPVNTGPSAADRLPVTGEPGAGRFVMTVRAGGGGYEDLLTLDTRTGSFALVDIDSLCDKDMRNCELKVLGISYLDRAEDGRYTQTYVRMK